MTKKQKLDRALDLVEKSGKRIDRYIDIFEESDNRPILRFICKTMIRIEWVWKDVLLNRAANLLRQVLENKKGSG